MQKKFSITSRNFLNMMRLSLVVSTYGGYPFFLRELMKKEGKQANLSGPWEHTHILLPESELMHNVDLKRPLCCVMSGCGGGKDTSQWQNH